MKHHFLLVTFLLCPALIAETKYIDLQKKEGRWVFQKPSGEEFFAIGVNHTSLVAKKNYMKNIYYKNSLGSNREIFHLVGSDLKSWGFNSGGYDAPKELRAYLPSGTRTPFMKAAFYHEKLNYVDVFSQEWISEVDERAKLACEEVNGDSNFLAHFLVIV